MSKLGTIDLRMRLEGGGPTMKFGVSYVVSNIGTMKVERGKISGISKTLNLGLASGFTGIQIRYASRVSTYASGVYVFLSGQKYNSNQHLSLGWMTHMHLNDQDRGVHVYAPGGGAYIEYAVFEV